jgi:hypothetical protein
MNRRLLAWVTVFVLTNVLTSAQSLQMNRWLNIGSEKERTRKLISLGIKDDQARLAASDEIQWRPIRSESQRSLAILFVPCGAFEESALYLLEEGNNRWHVKDSTGFDCHYDDSVSIETAPLRTPNADDILVHHECEERGTGYLEQHFNVFAVSSGKFKIILNVKEVVNESGWPEKSEFRLRSKFAVLSSQRWDSRIIEETQCANDNGRISLQKRDFTWDQSAFRLMPSEFASVGVINKRTRDSCR